KANDVQAKTLEFFRKGFFVQYTKNRVFAVAGGHDRNTQIDETALVLHTETAVLWNASFRDIQFTQHLDAREHGRVPFLGYRLHRMLQNAVNAVLHRHLGVARLNMNVTGSPLQSGKD